MSVVVGYVPTKEGRAALRRASEESLLRRTKLIVINSSRGGKDFDADEARRFEAELLSVQNHLDEAGVEHEVQAGGVLEERPEVRPIRRLHTDESPRLLAGRPIRRPAHRRITADRTRHPGNMASEVSQFEACAGDLTQVVHRR